MLYEVITRLDIADMDIENGDTPFKVGFVNQNLTVKTARSQQCRVKYLGAVGSRQDNNRRISYNFV